ncbi:related to Inositol phosphosphingolipids phospholipase C [Saccharomycodes ludwigii]|uniref:Related to Inositol phosphosphingolipids phospholipase C n=1 Tax=Saccharomycodes ludwigii TaxID=36035 RepID=A0A376B464_9ASCO|nr:related to Inositol phosphosphingolipids phospholipase C [Saccharomycodes ludwigii]
MSMTHDNAMPKVKFLTFNTWGLKYVSKHRSIRLRAIADKLSGKFGAIPLTESLYGSSETYQESYHVPDNDDDYDVIALQEIWVQEDWDYITSRTRHVYPYSRLFSSGILTGPGLAILSKIPIEKTFLYRFPINGRPSAFWRGDWYVGKSLSVTILKPLNEKTPSLCILNSHMHAPYAQKGDAAYLCHRSCQAWDLSKLAKLYSKAGYAVVVVGDLNSKPGTLPHKFLTMETGLVDSFEQLHQNDLVSLDRIKTMTPWHQIIYGGTTCDSILNTWRAQRKPWEACRLDYALIDPNKLETVDASVKFTERIPNIGSFSDHFAYSCTLQFKPINNINKSKMEVESREFLIQKLQNYNEMLSILQDYNKTARWQKTWRGFHFLISSLYVIGVHVVVTFTAEKAGWSSVLWLFSTVVVTVTGVLDGLISFLFGNKELRALQEVSREVLDSRSSLQQELGNSY